MVNLSTGPVSISPQVMKALHDAPISHRSPVFKKLYHRTTGLLSEAFNAQQTFLLTGSGTLANEVMLNEIKNLHKKGLILSNGEFGNRLVEQARRHQLLFDTYSIEWGRKFDAGTIKKRLEQNDVHWILFCHCETSTGVINELQTIIALSKPFHCACFVDCMSTVGTMHLDLAGVSMATASSGKGLASVPGLAIVFSNMDLVSKKEGPVYIDLSHYAKNDGIPFTISSNLVKALFVSIQQKLQPAQFQFIQYYGERIFETLNKKEIVPFSNAHSKVFTIVIPGEAGLHFNRHMKQNKLLLSSESEYLKCRQWQQQAGFGYYRQIELEYVLKVLN